MIDFIIAGLGAGLIAFVALFAVSFVVLGAFAVTVRFIVNLFRRLTSYPGKAYKEQTAGIG